MAWFPLRVREVPGSIPGWALFESYAERIELLLLVEGAKTRSVGFEPTRENTPDF